MEKQVLEGKTLIFVIDGTVWAAKNGIGGNCSIDPIVADDYNVAYEGVHNAIADSEGHCKILEDTGPLPSGRCVMIVGCTGNHAQMQQLVRESVNTAALHGGIESANADTVSIPALVPCRDNHGDREAHAELG